MVEESQSRANYHVFYCFLGMSANQLLNQEENRFCCAGNNQNFLRFCTNLFTPLHCDPNAFQSMKSMRWIAVFLQPHLADPNKEKQQMDVIVYSLCVVHKVIKSSLQSEDQHHSQRTCLVARGTSASKPL